MYFDFSRRCTVRNACQQASQSLPRWLSFGAGQQCIDFEQVLPDRIPINQMTTVSIPYINFYYQIKFRKVIQINFFQIHYIIRFFVSWEI